MNDEQFERLLRTVAQDYHRPGDPPRDAMWAQIQAKRSAKRVISLVPRRPWLQPLAWVTGVAAVLALGIGLGRLSVRPGATDAEGRRGAGAGMGSATAEGEPATAAAYRHAITEHLGQTETFLTLFKSGLNRRGADPVTTATARQLLATNRLLLASPAAADQGTRLLLEDIELVLARIIQLSPDARAEDRELITEGMDQAGVLPRLRMEVPAGSDAFPAQGAL